MRVLAIDYGGARIGLAVSDELGMIATPLEVLHRKTIEKDLAELKRIVEEKEVERIVVGLPLNMNGTEGPQAIETRQFVEKLQTVIDVPVEFQDERLSTFVAEQAMLEADLSRKKRKARRDKVAACLILRAYLERKEK